MLEKVGFKNFLALRDVEIDLEPFTVIVGPNSSGKSTILEAIKRVCEFPRHTEAPLLRVKSDGYAIFDPDFFVSKGVSLSSDKISFHYLGLLEGEANWSFGARESIFFTPPQLSQHLLTKPKILKFSAVEAAKASYSESLSPVLEETGQGLATICSYLQNLNPDSFSWIQENLRSTIPNLKRFRIKPARVPAIYWFNINLYDKVQRINRVDEATGQELVFDFSNAENIPASHVSEGTLFALAVLVSVAASNSDTTVLIDDLERGLHPKAVRDLIRALRDIQKIASGLQIVATSHSPYILDRLSSNEVRVVTLDPERGTLVAKLEDYPDFDRWREAMTPGEFWSFVGEDWVKDLFKGKVRD